MLNGFKKSAVSAAIVTTLALTLAACGGGGGDDAPAAGNPPPSGQNPNPNPNPNPGNQTPVLASNFAATGPSDVWHWVAASDNGQVMVAGQADLTPANLTDSPLVISRDGGATWVDSATAGTGIWISADVSGDGNRIVAVEYQGDGMVMSTNGGQSFAPVALPAGVGSSPGFESVTISKDGSRIAAVIQGGTILVGTVDGAGAVTWLTPAGLPASAPGWRSIDSSADGQIMVAVAEDPAVYISTNGGANWAPLAVTVDGAAVLSQNWYRVKLSDDGQTIAMAGNQFGGSSGNGLYVSKNGGTSFARASDVAGDYTGISMSGDGGVIVATVSNNNVGSGNGQVLMSTNGGTSFAPLAVTVNGAAVTETDWRAVALSGDATRLAIAAGRFISDSSGQIYVSNGRRP